MQCNTDKYEYNIRVQSGNDETGQIYGGKSDLGLGVYDVLIPDSVPFLERVS